jgi:hypothetical protein
MIEPMTESTSNLSTVAATLRVGAMEARALAESESRQSRRMFLDFATALDALSENIAAVSRELRRAEH